MPKKELSERTKNILGFSIVGLFVGVTGLAYLVSCVSNLIHPKPESAPPVKSAFEERLEKKAAEKEAAATESALAEDDIMSAPAISAIKKDIKSGFIVDYDAETCTFAVDRAKWDELAEIAQDFKAYQAALYCWKATPLKQKQSEIVDAEPPNLRLWRYKLGRNGSSPETF